jgi:hypothetical protein
MTYVAPLMRYCRARRYGGRCITDTYSDGLTPRAMSSPRRESFQSPCAVSEQFQMVQVLLLQ